MKRTAALLLLFVWLGSGCTTPQSPIVILPNAAGGTIEGLVTIDGQALPGATVTLTRDGASASYTAVSQGDGRFRFLNVAPGTYAIRSEIQGLQTISRRINVSGVYGAAIELPMRLSSVAEAITVTSAAPMAAGMTMGTPAPVISGAPGYDNLQLINGATLNQNARLAPRPEYAAIRKHTFVAARKEPVTTFAIDVDQASYTNVRRILAGNQMPPADAVRVEEMINYFTYRYAQPADNTPFAIATEVAGCPWNAKNRLLRIGIQGRNLEQWKMAPNNLVFLLDVSGSMSPQERLPLIKSAFRVLVDQLRAEDKVSIVVYAGAAGLVLPPTSGTDRNTIFAALDKLEAGGSTAGGQGIELAYKVARDNFLASGNNRVILATDGDFNVGISSLEDIRKL
ncbi:MAG TPA: von Willebrand factor type A domain-containing protein, partial [Thermoanaerobaculia bacterium]|nr:von Willebrand factor type A domain-containing protein [Thermoanaerobaculia bacterium]